MFKITFNMTLKVNIIFRHFMIITMCEVILFMIQEKRKSLNLTQEEMSERLGISLRQYVRIDNERAFPRRDILKKLINELNLTDEEIGQYIKILTQNIA